MDRPLLKTAEWKSIGKPMRPWRSVYSWPVTQSKFRSQTVRHHYHIVRHTWTLLLHRVMGKKTFIKIHYFQLVICSISRCCAVPYILFFVLYLFVVYFLGCCQDLLGVGVVTKLLAPVLKQYPLVSGPCVNTHISCISSSVIVFNITRSHNRAHKCMEDRMFLKVSLPLISPFLSAN